MYAVVEFTYGLEVEVIPNDLADRKTKKKLTGQCGGT